MQDRSLGRSGLTINEISLGSEGLLGKGCMRAASISFLMGGNNVFCINQFSYLK